MLKTEDFENEDIINGVDDNIQNTGGNEKIPETEVVDYELNNEQETVKSE